MANILHYGRREHIETKMEAYSNDTYEKLPFTCDATLSDRDVENRIAGAIYKKHPPSHFGGCGYSCRVSKFVRETPTDGYVILMHYQGIGD